MIETTVLEKVLDTINEYNESHFNLEESIEEAKEILQFEMVSHELSSCHYEKMKWFLEIPYESRRESIVFEDIKNAVQFNKSIRTDRFIDIVKCWASTLIDEGHNPQRISSIVNEGFLTFLNISKGLTDTNYDDLADEIVNMTDSMRRNVCITMLNFFDYYNEFDFSVDEYVSIIHSVKPKSEKSIVRIIPPSKDILIFSRILEDFFSSNLSEIEYLKWFPVWLWWNLTNLIPMRPSEYCSIQRDCLFERNGKFYIKLPRHKIKAVNARRIQVLDEISIPEHLYQEIVKYKCATDRFGRTDTLISYMSIPKTFKGQYWLPTEGTQAKRLNPYRFTNSIFRMELKSFYKHVIFEKYNITLNKNPLDSNGLSISQQLKPGDTRHIAFVNLNRQGYHPVEIARLGGHISLEAQNHYFGHIQNYVDLEILELVSSIDLDSFSNKIDATVGQQSTTIGTSFIEKFVLKPSGTNVKIMLKDGYCTDPMQNCMVEDCWECDSWRISREELSEKQHILSTKLNASKSEIHEVVESLKTLYMSIYDSVTDDYYSSENPEMRKELIKRSKRIDNAIRRYINLTSVKERIEFVGNEG
ncbi:hypothetical protein [Neobacillus vireti]|uniref:Phage integrase family protein n=1 Tax=Neobacillus vireti LMG 21834 TaxID=1131730 RepID=A0AB94ITZ7_9BACI|nr:hypothetical protein [Neobacillus vireti]ETI70559.1 Phage integrase family protein [Neobacillus vireti LMG 21834]KLT18410.1 hypothetical protein AA980_08825 [Neobacillus vireti]